MRRFRSSSRSAAGIDYGTANAVKSKLDAVADTAALSAVDHVAIAGTAADAQTTAQNTFTAEVANLNNITLSNVTATVTDSSTCRTAVVNYTATKNNVFMGLFGIPTTTITGQSTAAAGLSTYIDFYLLLDNTPSMGVGATTADINKMVTNTSDQCAFACHDLNNPDNYYNLVKKLGVTMRIDVLKSAPSRPGGWARRPRRKRCCSSSLTALPTNTIRIGAPSRP